MDNLLIYIGTYTSEKDNSKGIYVYKLDLLTGQSTYVSSLKDIDNPSFLQVSSDAKYLYAVSEVFEANGEEGGLIEAFSIDKNTGDLTFLNAQSTKGACPCHLKIDNTGKFVIVTNYMGGNIALFPILENGTLGEVSDLIQHEGASMVNMERQEGAHPHSVTISPDNQFAIAADLGKDTVMSYPLDSQNGKLKKENIIPLNVLAGGGPRHMVFHPNGKYIVLLNELGNTLETYAFDKVDGSLTLCHSVSTLPQGFKGENIAADIHFHPNGKFLYASNRGHDSIIICSFDAENGGIEVIDFQATLGEHPRNFCLDTAGNILMVANLNTDNIITFSINNTSGKLTPINKEIKVPKPVCVNIISQTI